jgi:hypothetical protein
MFLWQNGAARNEFDDGPGHENVKVCFETRAVLILSVPNANVM